MNRASAFSIALTIAAAATVSAAARADDAQIQRGKYLVTLGGCSDCHTPGTFLGKPDMSRFLGGSDVGFAMPGLGVFPGRNITPDKETGIGAWTSAQIVTALRTGVRPDGRKLAPIMPYQALAALSDADAQAIAAFLKSVPAVRNAVAGPFGPSEKPSTFVFAVLPGDVYNDLPKPQAGK